MAQGQDFLLSDERVIALPFRTLPTTPLIAGYIYILSWWPFVAVKFSQAKTLGKKNDRPPRTTR